MSGPNLAASKEKKIVLFGPPCPVVSNQSKLPNGITTDHFEVNPEKLIATCPAGFSASLEHNQNEKVRFQFPEEACASCFLRERCCTGKRGRTVCVGLTYPLLQEARLRQKTEASKDEYHKHCSGVEGDLLALARGNGMQVSRYIGNRKCHLQAVFSGTAANLKRVALWMAGERPKRHHQPWDWLTSLPRLDLKESSPPYLLALLYFLAISLPKVSFQTPYQECRGACLQAGKQGSSYGEWYS